VLTLDQPKCPENLPAGLPSAIVSRRPDVKTAELALVIANSKVGISKAEMYPALSDISKRWCKFL
jgi:multidrug efflux system outer membrane protein